MGKVAGLNKMSASDANHIGYNYFNGIGVSRDYEKAAECFQYAASKGSASAHFNLGLCYSGGHGYSQDNLQAAKHYILAQEKGETDAKVNLEELNLSGQECNQIGLMFESGKVFKKSRTKEKEWYWRALDKQFSAASHNLAMCFSDINDPGYDLDQAIQFYEEAIENGYESSKLSLRNLFDNLDFSKNISADFGENFFRYFKKPAIKSLTLRYVKFMNKYYPDESVNSPGRRGSTILHKAAKSHTLKNCARLMLLGAQHVPDDSLDMPFYYLKSKDKYKVQRLQSQFASILAKLSRLPAGILTEQTTIDGGFISKEHVNAMYSDLSQIAGVSHLLNLAKYAALGLHKLSGRAAVINTDYDSDHDDEPEYAPSESQKLTIRLSATSNTVEHVSYWDSEELPSGMGGKGAYGVYHHKSDKNAIFIGVSAERSTKTIRATIIHELTHFLANEIYENQCRPYFDSDLSAVEMLDQALEEIVDKHNNGEKINDILLAVFSYQPASFHGELIVRVPQILVEYPDGLAQLTAQAPLLLNYYMNKFLPSVKNHSKTLEKCALGNWPKELFENRSSVNFSI